MSETLFPLTDRLLAKVGDFSVWGKKTSAGMVTLGVPTPPMATTHIKKSFTFGNPCLKGVLSKDMEHLDEFRLVGGAVVGEGKHAFLIEIEQKRLEKWKATIAKLRHAPIPWKKKAHIAVITQRQMTYGQ